MTDGMYLYLLKGDALVEYSDSENFREVWKEYFLLVVARTAEEALKTAETEKKVRWGIRKMAVENIKVIGRLEKPALLYWSEFGPSELDEDEFTPIGQHEGISQ